jgi:hypothetical protein
MRHVSAGQRHDLGASSPPNSQAKTNNDTLAFVLDSLIVSASADGMSHSLTSIALLLQCASRSCRCSKEEPYAQYIQGAAHGCWPLNALNAAHYLQNVQH